jgi:hypothetical protein
MDARGWANSRWVARQQPGKACERPAPAVQKEGPRGGGRQPLEQHSALVLPLLGLVGWAPPGNTQPLTSTSLPSTMTLPFLPASRSACWRRGGVSLEWTRHGAALGIQRMSSCWKARGTRGSAMYSHTSKGVQKPGARTKPGRQSTRFFAQAVLAQGKERWWSIRSSTIIHCTAPVY